MPARVARMLRVDEVRVVRMSRDELRHEPAVVGQRHAPGPHVIQRLRDQHGPDAPAAEFGLHDRVTEDQPLSRTLVDDAAHHLIADQRVVDLRLGVVAHRDLRGFGDHSSKATGPPSSISLTPTTESAAAARRGRPRSSRLEEVLGLAAVVDLALVVGRERVHLRVRAVGAGSCPGRSLVVSERHRTQVGAELPGGVEATRTAPDAKTPLAVSSAQTWTLRPLLTLAQVPQAFTPCRPGK